MSQVVCPQCANECDERHKFCPVCGFPIAELLSNKEDPLIGTTLPGGYQILELIGVGGMGRVYRAEQKILGRTVAVKIIHPHLLGDESASARFITEARATSRLNHPNSVGIIDFGKKDGQLYIVMEFLRGRDLARVAYEDGPLPFPRIIDVLCQVLAALAEAHHLGIIHRDLKPENIVLQPLRMGGDFVKVVDFGLAKIRESSASHPGITMPGIVCGTPDYMAPEQGRGDPLDGRSDLYACGVILYQLLTGRLPFESDSPTRVVLMHMTMPLPSPAQIAPERNIPAPLIEVTRKALEKEADNRYQNAHEFGEALRTVLTAIKGTPPQKGSVVCSACRAPVPRNQKFCGECGTRVTYPGPVTEPRRAPVDRPSSAVSLPLPFVGREDDLDWLEDCRHTARASLDAARIVGDAGVGKTRLLREFLEIAAEQGDLVIETGPDPYWAEVSYFALRKAIVKLAGLPENGSISGDLPAVSPEAKRGLSEVFDRSETASITATPLWTQPVAGSLSIEDRRFIAAEALRWAITRAHQSDPRRLILLAIDDLHAVDGASRNAFADVIAEPPLAPILILGVHSSEVDPGWDGSYRTLSGLPKDIAASLVRGGPPSADDGDDDLRIPPLYLDQLVRFGLEGGSDPPARMADLIALRIERLPQDARRTLQAIAVVGDATDRPTLRRLLPDIPSFDDLLKVLADAGMIEEQRGPSAGGAKGRVGCLRTAHPLIHEITLATTPVAVRKELHAKAAVDQDNEPLPLPLEVQALHAYHAQSSFEALMLLEQVADRACARGDQGGSVLALRRCLDLARRELFRGELDDPMRAVIIFARKLGEALARAGDLSDADGLLREALDLTGPSGKDRALVLGSLAFVARERARAAEATVFLQEAISLARQIPAGDLAASLERMRREWAQQA
ncbi:MAG TPA: protein kinase [Polyangiaceae bacterium]|nr:protein kinase [Polyangiaceae bacterium]